MRLLSRPPTPSRPAVRAGGADAGSAAALPALALEIKGLDKVYVGRGGMARHALKGIDLSVPRGAFFGLLGPNGAGKSTLINILAGLVVKTGGAARIMGLDVDERPRRARLSIGVVPQELNFDPFFSPREVLEFQAGLYGVPRRERRTDELLAAVGLTEKADAHARALSGGMRRRLLVAKALVHGPPLVILDEPTAGVDVELRRSLWTYMRELNRSGVTIVLTTHYLDEAEQLCDTIAIIDEGRLVACEPTGQLIGRLDEKELRVTPATPVERVPPALAAAGWSLDAEGCLRIRYRRGAAPVEAILDQLRSCAIAVADLSTAEADLEDIFVQLTTRSPARPDLAA